jgi:thiamine transporter ThiT
MSNEVKFSRIEFESNRPKLGVSLSCSILTICIAIIALTFGVSSNTCLAGLVFGLIFSWIAWPMHYLISKATKSGKVFFKNESNQSENS